MLRKKRLNKSTFTAFNKVNTNAYQSASAPHFSLFYKLLIELVLSVPDGLGVRISGFHPDGPGSIPGLGAIF